MQKIKALAKLRKSGSCLGYGKRLKIVQPSIAEESVIIMDLKGEFNNFQPILQRFGYRLVQDVAMEVEENAKS